jgi:hypothetical protein
LPVFGVKMVTDAADLVSVQPYTPEHQQLWDGYVAESRNGVFLFNRGYMEYHSDRFKDHSLMFFKNGQLIGLLPANIKDSALQSHGGLTFGGVIVGYSTKTVLMQQIFKALTSYCRSLGIKSIFYKPIPYIYHSIPANEDLYALFLYNAKLVARNVSSSIYLPYSHRFGDGRISNIRRALKHKLSVKQTADLDSFMDLLKETLSERHNVKPVHTADEMKFLASRFPENIKLFASYDGDIMLSGLLMYESKNVAHVQYAANSKEGRNIGAQDIIEDYLINTVYKDKRYYDFGISTENFGHDLNEGLMTRKEAFGAYSVMYDQYEITL